MRNGTAIALSVIAVPLALYWSVHDGYHKLSVLLLLTVFVIALFRDPVRTVAAYFAVNFALTSLMLHMTVSDKDL